MSKPTVSVVLILNSALERIVNPTDPLHEAVRAAAAHSIAGLLDGFGIPGSPEVEIRGLDEPPAPGHWIRLAVHGMPCRFADGLLTAVYCYQTEVPLQPAQDAEVFHHLQDLCAAPAESGVARNTLIEFFQLALPAIIGLQPELLLGPEQIAAWREDFLAEIQPKEPKPLDWPPDEAFFAELLNSLLRMGLSLAGRAAIATVLQGGLEAGREPGDIAEDLIAALQPKAWEIQLPHDYFREITLAQTETKPGEFALLRDGLFYELGIYYPDFQFVLVEDLKPSSFRFKLGQIATLPLRGLGPKECLVNGSEDRLAALQIRGRPAANPANSNECAIIDADLRQVAEGAGFTTWQSIGYIVLAFAAELRRQGWRCVTNKSVQAQLSSLGRAFPALRNAALIRFTPEQIARTLRSVLAEEISVRNLRTVLELLLQSDYIVVKDLSKYIVFDDRLPLIMQPREPWDSDAGNLAAVVRSGLKRQISHKYTRGASTLIVYLLDPEIEARLTPDARPEADLAEKILKAVRQELQSISRYAQIPAILTTIEVRAILRDLLKYEFPTLAVLAYQELSPNLNIQPIARISFS